MNDCQIFFLENEFKIGKIDNTLYLKTRGQNLLIMHVYVDDIIFSATSDSLCEKFSKLMKHGFEMSMNGELSFFLEPQIKKTPSETIICHEKYFKVLLANFHMNDAKSIDTLIETSSKMDVDELSPLVNDIMYRGIMRSLLYLTTSRPDILFCVKMCVRFQTCPT